METKELCPICGEGHVTSHVQQIEHEYKGHKAMLASHYQECDTCLSEFAGAREGKLSKRGVMAFRKSVDGLLTGAEICALRDKYKLTQTQAAKLFGLYPRKGAIQVGSDADLVVYDPQYRGKLSMKTQEMAVDYNAFEGWEIEGRPTEVSVRGKVQVRGGKFVGGLGHGQLLPRKAEHF